jgi:hypothetical protein
MCICELPQAPGFYGVVVGLGLFFLVWSLAWWNLKGETFEMDPQGEPGAFVPLLTIYMDIAKVVLGLASGSIALLVGTFAALTKPHEIHLPSFLHLRRAYWG